MKIDIQKYLKKWETNEELGEPEKALGKLFNDYHSNDNVSVILAKIYALNDAYSTQLNRWKGAQVTMAKHIKKQNLDRDLSRGERTVVDKIRIGHNICKKEGEKEVNFYSFATKYCSFHYQNKYPIYDSNVREALIELKSKGNGFSFDVNDLNVYPKFVEIIENFREVYGLKGSFRDIDKYLYLRGRAKKQKSKKK